MVDMGDSRTGVMMMNGVVERDVCFILFYVLVGYLDEGLVDWVSNL